MAVDLKKFAQEQYMVPFKIVAVYIVWKIFHHFVSMPGTALNTHWLTFVANVGHLYAVATSGLLSLFGMKASAEGININLLESHRQVWVQDHCLAIPAMVIFTGSVIFFKGSARDKASFLITGLLGIVLINILRLIFVAYAFVNMSDVFFRINHSFVYVLVTYSFIFFMLARWMNRSLERIPTIDLID